MKVVHLPVKNFYAKGRQDTFIYIFIKVWTTRGLLITDPVERGLRVIEITLLTEPLHPELQVT